MVETYVVKPAAVLAIGTSAWLESLLRTFSLPVVRVDALAAVMIDLALDGGSEQVVLNKVIVERGRELLARQR